MQLRLKAIRLHCRETRLRADPSGVRGITPRDDVTSEFWLKIVAPGRGSALATWHRRDWSMVLRRLVKEYSKTLTQGTAEGVDFSGVMSAFMTTRMDGVRYFFALAYRDNIGRVASIITIIITYLQACDWTDRRHRERAFEGENLRRGHC